MESKNYAKEKLELKLELLKKVEAYLNQALAERNSTMVAAIAELLKSL